MQLQIEVFTFNAFQENSYVLWDEDKTAVIIDPGCYSKNEKDELRTFIEAEELNVVALLNTHAHIDHVLGNAFVKSTFNVPYYLHADDLKVLKAVEGYAHLYGFEGYELSPEPDFFLEDNQTLTFGKMVFQVMHTPGHAPGHVVFYHKESGSLINGDVLFRGSFGRVDLPGGNIDILKSSIFNRLFTLPEETQVYCGHGPSTTIGIEKKTNYILQF